MTTQTATILVSDMVGSTDQRMAVGEDRAEELRRLHDRALSDAAVASGGVVVKGLGDGLLVRFPGAAEAMAAAVAMQQAVEALGRREGVESVIRVGISSGDVTLENGDCFGTPVIEAARLCDAAGGGEIYAAEVVTVLARGRGGHETEPVGELELKGLSDPVATQRVLWEPLQLRADLRAPAPYVGREAERETLREVFASAAEGRGGLVLIVGEPGIGKTRLVSELCQEVEADAGAVVLSGGCHDGEVVAWAPFVEALGGWTRRTPASEVREVLGVEARVIQRLVPAVADVLDDVGPPPDLPADEARQRLHDSVAAILRRLAADAPVVLVLDDLHWADAATVGLLRSVARVAKQLPLLVVGTYRDTDLDRRHPLAEALPLLRREVEPTRLALVGLDARAVQDLLARLADHEVPAAFAELLTRQTAGNPFFLREMLLHLVEVGTLRLEDGVWVAAEDLATAIPEGIREVIGRRVSQLSEEAQSLLGIGALFEVEFSLPVAAEVAGLSEAEALDAVDEALESQVVAATEHFDQYAFTHALFRQTLAGELNPSRQVRVHRAIAESLDKRIDAEPTPAEAAVLAGHWYQSAAMPGAERGVPAALTLAADATHRYAHHEAHRALGMALELLPDGDERRSEILLARAAAGLRAWIELDVVEADARAAAELIAAEHGPDTAADRLAELDQSAFSYVEARWLLASIARPWLAEHRRDLTWALIRQAELDQADFNDPDHPGLPLDDENRRELIEVVQALRRAGEDTSGLGLQFSSRASALEQINRDDHAGSGMAGWIAGDAHYTIEAWRNFIAGAEGNPSGLAFGNAMLARTLAVAGAHADADTALTEAFTWLSRSSSEGIAFQTLAAESLIAGVRGRLPSAIALEQLDAMSHSPQTRWAAVAVVASTAFSLSHQGEAASATLLLDQAMVGIERAPGYSPNYPLIAHFCAEAMWQLEATDHRDALETNLRAKVLEPDIRYPEALPRLAMARLCALDGRIDEARNWATACRRVVEDQDTPPLMLPVEHFEAELELRLGPEGDPDLFRAAIARGRAGCEDRAMTPWLDRLAALETRADNLWP